MNLGNRPFFFDPVISISSLREQAFGVVEIQPVDIIDFPDEAGGDAKRELGVVFQPGMDEIVVSSAEIKLRAGSKDLDVAFTPREPLDGLGVFFSLAKPSRLKKIGIKYSVPAGTPGTVHVVVRAATPQGSGFAPGPPLFADPPFAAPGPMFSGVLTGMTVSGSGDVKTLTLPSVQGSAWLIQIATGDSVANMTPLAVKPQIQSVTIAALPFNLTITLQETDGPVTLWNHPGLLIPETGYQTVSFSPLAQKHLSKALKAGPSGGQITLSVPLAFHSDSGCSVEVSSQTLTGRYVVHPLASDPLQLSLRGDWVQWALSAPVLPVVDSGLRITATLLGRELNGDRPSLRWNRHRQVFASLRQRGLLWPVGSCR